MSSITMQEAVAELLASRHIGQKNLSNLKAEHARYESGEIEAADFAEYLNRLLELHRREPAKADVQPAPDRASEAHSASPEPIPAAQETWMEQQREQAPVKGTGLPTTFQIAVAPKYNKPSTNHVLTLTALAEMIRKLPAIEDKEEGLILYPGRFDAGINPRKLANIQACTGAPFDFDGRNGDKVKREDFEEVCRKAGVEVITWLTHSAPDDPTGYTFRALMPYAKELPVDLHRPALAAIGNWLGMVPDSIHHAAQGFFCQPRPGIEHDVRVIAGKPIDTLVDLHGLEAPPDHQERASGDLGQVLTPEQVADAIVVIDALREQGLHEATEKGVWHRVIGALALYGEQGEELAMRFSKDGCRTWQKDTLKKLKHKRENGAMDIGNLFAIGEAHGIENPAKGRRRGAAEAEPQPNTGEVIAKLLALGAEEAKLVWVKMVLPMNRINTAEVTRALNTRYGWGLRDMAGELADEKARIAAEAAVAVAEANIGRRAVIELNNTQTGRMAKQAEVALLKVVKPHDYCMFSNNLSCVDVRVIPGMHAIDRPDLLPPPVVMIAPLVDAEIVAKLERTVAFCSLNEHGKPTTVHPVPRPVVDQLRSSLREFGPRTVPVITGIATRPMVLSDGTILNTEGLDPRTGLFLYKTAVIPIKAFTKSEAEQALDELRKGDFSAGFDFGTPLDRDTAIATLLTGIQRRLLPEAPGTLINATVQSSGKTTLARRIHLILTGRDMPVAGVPREEVEMKKTVEALLRYNPEMVCFDNIPDGHTFRSETLARVMTSSEMSARILGVTENMLVPTNVLWLLTGNNVGLGNDELTRFMRVNLSPNSFSPETRHFTRPDIVLHAREIRERVLQLALGVIAGFLVSKDALPTKSRFPEWDRLVRQPLIWCGGEDVATCFEENTERSESKAALADLIEALLIQYPEETFTLATLTNDIKRVEEAKPAFFEALSVIKESLVSLRAKDLTSIGSVGHTLNSVQGQLVRLRDGAGAKLINKRSPGLGRHWKIERVEVQA